MKNCWQIPDAPIFTSDNGECFQQHKSRSLTFTNDHVTQIIHTGSSPLFSSSVDLKSWIDYSLNYFRWTTVGRGDYNKQWVQFPLKAICSSLKWIIMTEAAIERPSSPPSVWHYGWEALGWCAWDSWNIMKLKVRSLNFRHTALYRTLICEDKPQGAAGRPFTFTAYCGVHQIPRARPVFAYRFTTN